MSEQPLLIAEGLTKFYGRQRACRGISFQLHEGEVRVGSVGEHLVGEVSGVAVGGLPRRAGRDDAGVQID